MNRVCIFIQNDKIVELIFENGEYDEPIIKPGMNDKQVEAVQTTEGPC